MTLIEQIKSDQLAARKALIANKTDAVLNVKAPLLTTLIGEAEVVGKNAGNRAPTDEEVVSTLKKFIKGAQETIRALNDADRVDSSGYGALNAAIMTEDILTAYLPKQMSEAALDAFFADCLRGGVYQTMGSAMARLKSVYPGLYDGKLASQIAKRYF